jgi:cell division septation protein DedD
MNRHLTWTLAATLLLAACGAGDRKKEKEPPAANPPATAPQPAPAAPASTAPAATEAPVATEQPVEESAMVHPTERLYTVQIAAYLSPDSATVLAQKLEQRGLPVWTMEVRVGDRTYHRIRVGAHPGLGEVRKLGTQLSTQYRQKVWVAPVDMSSRIPANAVEATRALLARS